MATNMRRQTLSIPVEIEEAMEKLKKQQFYNKSYSEMYRYLLSLGIESFAHKEAHQPDIQAS